MMDNRGERTEIITRKVRTHNSDTREKSKGTRNKGGERERRARRKISKLRENIE